MSVTAAQSGVSGGGNARASTPKQRQRQQELIEVRLRPQRAARLRNQRLFVWSSVLLLVATLAGGGYWMATRGVAWLFFNNPDYNVSLLNVETDGVLARDAVLEAGDIREGMNIFHLDLDRAKARIETLPQVQRASVRRQLPNQVTVTVNERKPVAWIAPDTGAKTREETFASPQSLLVDAGGVLLKPRKLLAHNYTLPIIRHANVERLAPGQIVDTEEMRSTLDLLRAHQESMVGARFQITEIDLARGYGLLVTDRHGLQVLFGLDDPELQLKTLDTLLANVASAGRRPATISLMTLEARQRNIPVTFQPEAPPVGPAEAVAAPEAVTGGGATPPAGAHGATVNPPVTDVDAAKAKAKGKGAAKPDVKTPRAEGGRDAVGKRPKTAPRESSKPKTPAKPRSEPMVRKALPVTQPFQPTP